MSGIRPLGRNDLPQVVDLFELVMRSGCKTRLPQLTPFFEQTLFDNPWTDAELPSLVYEDEGGDIVGAICSNARRLLFEGEPIRMSCSAYLITHPRVRKQAAGALLMRAHLSGAQDLTITDGATDTVRRMWEALGGQAAHLSGLSFIKLFRPVQLASDQAIRDRAPRPVDVALRSATSALDWASARIVPSRLVPPATDATSEELTPATMLQHLEEVAGRVRLRPDYDAAYLEWLFGIADDITRWGPVQPGLVLRGPLWAELVRKNGRVQGWYVCHLRQGGLCRVLQLAATDHGVNAVFDHLVSRAHERGAAGLYGRLEPRLVAPASQHGCFLRFGPGRLLVHSRRPELVGAILAGDALLTRLDGEWW